MKKKNTTKKQNVKTNSTQELKEQKELKNSLISEILKSLKEK